MRRLRHLRQFGWLRHLSSSKESGSRRPAAKVVELAELVKIEVIELPSTAQMDCLIKAACFVEVSQVL